jgi:hypothetical protein
MKQIHAPIHYSYTIVIMKISKSRFQLGFWLAVCMPLPSYAGVDVPYWLYPEWIAAKVLDFHNRNSERFEQAQIVAQAKNNPNNPNIPTNASPNGEQNVRKTNLAPVETATAKINEKHLTKEELIELRKQLRQKQ